MARFERSREKRDFKGKSPNREIRGRKDFDDAPRGRRNSGKDFDRRGSRDFEMTKVVCSDCGSDCEVPFKPTSNKPIYCSDCFSKKDRGGHDRGSDRRSKYDSNSVLDQINEKLNKIMKALKIE